MKDGNSIIVNCVKRLWFFDIYDIEDRELS
jgi:hypothetical protein